MAEWINANERKPDTPREVIVRLLDAEVQGGRRITALWHDEMWQDPWGGDYNGELSLGLVTHWMDIDPPFPEPLS